MKNQWMVKVNDQKYVCVRVAMVKMISTIKDDQNRRQLFQLLQLQSMTLWSAPQKSLYFPVQFSFFFLFFFSLSQFHSHCVCVLLGQRAVNFSCKLSI